MFSVKLEAFMMACDSISQANCKVKTEKKTF